MNRQLSLLAVWLLAGAVFYGTPVRGAEPSVRVLIVDGQNNHDWKSTTPILQAILKEAGIFQVDVATTTANLAGFRPRFSSYDVIVSNYNGDDWPEETRRAFVDYMRSGGGLVSVHAADNSFPGWKEYNEMIGVGGWGGRNEKSGPMVYWKDGKFVRDTSPGRGGSHGSQHAFQIVMRDRTHPITRGLPEKWMHARDELYSNLRGPAKNMTVLATAHADPKHGGTGRHEPMLFTVRYGEGRAFHTTLGHHVIAMKCRGFAYTLQRGTEWAATGKVTLDRVPDDFPGPDRVRVWLSDGAFASVRTYDFGDSRKDLAAIEEAVRGASPATLRSIERKLLDALRAPETKYAGKQFVLRVLRRIGTEQSVAPLAELLTDEKLAHNARFALQRLPTPEATTALRRALGRSEGKLRIGIVSSLADRGDPSVVPELTPFIAANDAALSEAAIRALARIGGQEAARALAASELPVERQRSRDNALLVCAEKLLREGQKENALSVFRKLASDRSRDALIRLGAHRGIFLAEREKAVPAILPLLDAEDRALRQGAIQLLTTVPGEAVSRALAEALPRQKPERQVTIIEALVQRGDREVYPAVAEIAKSSDRRARIAALRALGTLGDARSVGLLAARLRADGEEGKVAFESLTSLRGEGVVPATLQLVRRADEPTRLKAIDALVARNETGAVPALLEAARDAESSVRAAAFRALGSLAGPAELEQLTGLLVERRDATDRQRVAQAIRSVAGRVDAKDAASRVIVTALGEADGPAEVLLLGVLPVLSTEDGIDAARSKIRSADRAVARAAVESLASWRNPAALPDLLDLARKGAPEHRAIALRGYIRLLSLPADRPSLATVKLLGEALELTGDVEDRRRILAQTAEFPCKEALALAEAHSGDEAVGETARKAAEKIRGILISNSLVARASHGSGEAKNAFDGDPRTRWTTGTPMRPGMWFTVDLGAERSVTRLILDSRDSPGDYPRGCEVHVSFDGKNWGKPVLTSPPQRPITRLVFPKPVRARFIKIVQTGETQGLWWSIHEMRIAFE